ncbi:glycoside hydrolase family 105 protein [Chitinophagaceae bacterium LWZ2-11]
MAFKTTVSLLFFAQITTVCLAQKSAGSGDLTHWDKGTSPQEVGQKVVNHFIASPHPNFNRPGPPKVITYPETCAWYGSLVFAKETGDKKMADELTKRFDPLFTNEASMIPPATNVDYTVFASVPLELYIQTKDKRYLAIGQRMADQQWTLPDTGKIKPEAKVFAANGYSWHTRLWIDDMFMITAAQAQTYRATGDTKYIDRAAKEMVMYLDSLQQPNGLFYHAPDVPFFWGRGDGWMAVGMAELLRSLPKNHVNRARIMKGYQAMMTSLLKYQGESGMWHQLIDEPASWEETSATGMFTYAFITGVRNGWLDKKAYAPAARKAWLALITHINDNAEINDVCEGTNKKNDKQYYLDRKRITGDMHGQAPVIWCATALLRKD